MELVVVLLLASLIPVSLQETVSLFRDKRQSLPDAQCGITYGLLSSREKQCINIGGDTSQFDEQLEGICSDETCRNAAKKLLVGCRSYIDSLLPSEYQDVDLGAFFDLFCTRASDHLYCYSHLPFFSGDGFDPLNSCQTVLSGGTCNPTCRQALEDYTSTCCFATYLQLLPTNDSRIQPTQIWQICDITPPQSCNGNTTDGNTSSNTSDTGSNSGSNTGSNSGSNTGSNAGSNTGTNTGTNTSSSSGNTNDHSDNSKKDHTGIIVAVCVSIVLLVLVVAITSIAVVIYLKKKKTQRWISVSSGDTVKMMSDNDKE